jgi:hypothetical protein
MGRPRKSSPLDIIDALAALAANFDYRVDPEDFILYELARAIDEDRASFNDPEFQALIDEGIREHVENNRTVRAELTGVFSAARESMNPEIRPVADRLIGALEDPESELRGAAVVVQTYTAYLFKQLEWPEGQQHPATDLADGQIGEWRSGRLTPDELLAGLTTLGPGAVAPAADLLFDLENPASARVAIEALGQIGSTPAARALAHAISEPMLDEDLEQLAFERLRALWPLPRHYMLVMLRRHEHEDLPVRWFQLFAECVELEAVDRTLEEFSRHAADPAHHEDLATILEFLRTSGDPAISAKIVDALNDQEMARDGVVMLEEFLKTWREPDSAAAANNPWRRRARLDDVHRRYQAAAQLADAGRTPEAIAALDALLAEEPGYPFATMLKRTLE